MVKYTESDIIEILNNIDFKLIEIVSGKIRKVKAKCKICGYIRYTKLMHYISGHRCRKCAGNKKYTLVEVRNKLKEIGFVLLDNTYVSNRTPIKIKCNKCEHIWFPIFCNLIKSTKSGCPNCSGKAKYSYDYVKNIIDEKNGLLISKDYKNIDSKLEVLCLKCNEIWKPTLRNIKYGNWCPTCANYFNGKGQAKLKEILESILPGEEIISGFRGFRWLKTQDTNKQQEIDIWVPKLKLAIEYDGEQHFKPIKFFGGNSRFERQKVLDQNKNKLIKTSNEIKYFIRLDYKYVLNKENIIKTLKENNVLIT